MRSSDLFLAFFLALLPKVKSERVQITPLSQDSLIFALFIYFFTLFYTSPANLCGPNRRNDDLGWSHPDLFGVDFDHAEKKCRRKIGGPQKCGEGAYHNSAV